MARIRVGDSLCIGGPWYTVWAIQGETVILTDAESQQCTRSLTELIAMYNGVRAHLGFPDRWLPIPKGHVYYGADKGYRKPVIGGYVKGENGEWVPHPDPDAYLANSKEGK